eukprot:CAMPEP_0171058756 /NCGR_PEP_ID=MMETSP0766_2-20121228/2713_1 /TAXON_ID=439317 /ORGANISM="Gambierdiscus australes, Strain CAWD 149" /LENGTH=48 /DNA_ID= /DNA_START= /DNA_END= /DNA_ORIENTATION=
MTRSSDRPTGCTNILEGHLLSFMVCSAGAATSLTACGAMHMQQFRVLT